MPEILPKDISDEEFKNWVKEKWGYKKLPIGGSTPPGTARFFDTGSWASKKPRAIHENCISCLNCYFYCPDNAVTMIEIEGKLKPQFNYEYCKGCGVCASECRGKPEKAIIMKDV
ncbi:MAG: 4Fe-4S dicluster-binding protein [Promethearchaeota archaeon]